MKVEQEENEFKPVIITLETEDELRCLTNLLGKIPFSDTEKNIVYGLYSKLNAKLEDYN